MAMRQFRRGALAGNKLWYWRTERQQGSWPLNTKRERNMRVVIATDHGGFGLKEELVAHLREAGHDVVDVGAHKLDAGDDYPDFVIPLAQAVATGKAPPA